MRTTRDRNEEWVRRHVHDWVEEGLVTPDEGEGIVRYEAGGPATGSTTGPGLGVAAEATAYVGSVLALLAGAFVMVNAWESVPVPARVLVGVVVAVLGLSGGQVVARVGDPGSLRLAGFLRAIGAAGAGFAVGVTTVESGAPDWVTGVAIGLVLLAIGGALWRNLDRPLQMLTTVAGAVTVAVAIGLTVEPPGWVIGAVTWIAGLAFGAAGLTERLRPPVLVACVGAVAVVLGAAGAYDLVGEAGVFAVVASAALVVVAGLASHVVPVLVIGVLALLQSTVQALATFVHGPVALLALLVVGITMVATVLRRARHPTP